MFAISTRKQLVAGMATALLAMAWSPSVLAQEEAEPAQHAPVTPAHPTLRLMPSRDVLGRPAVSAQGEQVSQLRDLLVVPRTAAITHAMISAGSWFGSPGQLVPVSIRELQWNDAAEHFVIYTDREQLTSRPTCDARRWRELAEQEWLGVLRQWEGFDLKHIQREAGHDASPAAAQPDPQPSAADQPPGQPVPRPAQVVGLLVRVGDLEGMSARARRMEQDEPVPSEAGQRGVLLSDQLTRVGEVDGTVIELTMARVPLVIVASGGVLGLGEDRRLVAWRAVDVLAEHIVLHAISPEQFQALPPVSARQISSLDRDRLGSFYQPFGLEPSEFGEPR